MEGSERETNKETSEKYTELKQSNKKLNPLYKNMEELIVSINKLDLALIYLI